MHGGKYIKFHMYTHTITLQFPGQHNTDLHPFHYTAVHLVGHSTTKYLYFLLILEHKKCCGQHFSLVKSLCVVTQRT